MKNNPTLLAIQTINLGELTLWSVEDEKRYQTLLLKESKGKWQMINGVNTKVEVTAKMFSEELKELIKQKETIINDLDEKESKRALAYLKINSLKVSKKLRAFEKFEKTNPSPIEVRKVTNPYG